MLIFLFSALSVNIRQEASHWTNYHRRDTNIDNSSSFQFRTEVSMTGLAILIAIGAMGALLLALSFLQLRAIKISFPVTKWHRKITQITICLAGLAAGSMLVLVFILIPAALGADMDTALFAFILSLPCLTCLSLSKNLPKPETD